MSASIPSAQGSRDHALDWLRVIAFGLLILYHIGMFFVPWGWHVKTAEPVEALQYPMLLLNPWRLALLFFISGAAMRYLLDKQKALRFAGSRVWRLFPVIVFGMIVIVAPQTYFELRQEGLIEPGYLAFWKQYLTQEKLHGITVPTWNHLWYVVYLMFYALLLALVAPVLRFIGNGPVGESIAKLWERPGVAALLILPTLPFVAYRITLDPHFEVTHNLIEDWANHARSLTMLVFGFYAAKSERFWGVVDSAWLIAGVLALAYVPVLGWALTIEDAVWDTQPWFMWPVRLMRQAYLWWIIVFLLGAARRFLSGDGPLLRYLNVAVFPLYIFHQTITVAAGYWVGTQEFSVWMEFAVLVGATVLGSLALFEITKRTGPFRLVFGMKP
ncbi:MAG: acyltransferase family protein [Pseudomonadota bacterium]